MKVAGQHNFSVPQDIVWHAVLDPGVLSQVVPGFERIEKTSDNEFEGTLSVQVGPVKSSFAGKVELSDIQAPHQYHLGVKGRGSSGFVTGKGQIKLREIPEGTELNYDLDLQIGGRIAGLGQRLLDSTSRALTKQALDNLAQQLEARESLKSVAPDTPPVATPAPSQAKFAAGVAKEVAKDMLSPRMRAAVMVLSLGLAALVAWWIFRAVSG